MTRARMLLAGVGSPHGDDQAGWQLVELLQQRQVPQLELVRLAKPIDLLDHLGTSAGVAMAELLICDTCRGAGPAGSCHRWTWPDADMPRMRWSGSHDFPLPAVLALADRLGRLPAHVTVRAIEGHNLDAGAPMSTEVQQAIQAWAASLAAELQLLGNA